MRVRANRISGLPNGQLAGHPEMNYQVEASGTGNRGREAHANELPNLLTSRFASREVFPRVRRDHLKSVFPSRTSRIARPDNDARNPRTTVSTSGSSGMGEALPGTTTPTQYV